MKFAVWSDAEGWLTEPLEQSDAYEALRLMTATADVADDDFDDTDDARIVVAVEDILVVLPVCRHRLPPERCETCKALGEWVDL